MTKHKAKAKFNQSAPANQPEPAVVTYADAPAAGKSAMEKLMEAIDRNPDSFEAVISYGSPPMTALATTANDMIKIQGACNAHVAAIASATVALESGLNAVDLGKFGEETMKMLKSLSSGAPDTSDKKYLQQVQDGLPKMLLHVHTIAGAYNALTDTLNQAADADTALIGASRDVGLYLGAGSEVLRRYNEEYIPEAKKQFGASGDPEDEQYLKDVIKRKEDFIDRMIVLEGCRAAAVISRQQLCELTETIEDQRSKVNGFVDSNRDNWQAMLTTADLLPPSIGAERGPDPEKATGASAPKKPKAPKPK